MTVYNIVITALGMQRHNTLLAGCWHFVANQLHQIATPKMAFRSFGIDGFYLVAAMQQACRTTVFQKSVVPNFCNSFVSC